MNKIFSLLLILFSQTLSTQPYIQEISNEVKVEYHQDGMIKIISSDKGKPIHHFNLKLENFSSNNQLLNFDTPDSVTRNSNSIKYIWNKNIIEEWQQTDTGLLRTLTLNEKPDFHEAKDKLTINSYFNTDLGGFSVGMDPFTWHYIKAYDSDPDTIDNLKIDELRYYLTDSNCNQIIANKYLSLQNKKLTYKFNHNELNYPVILKHEFIINKDHSSERNQINQIAVEKNTMAVSYYNTNFVEIYTNKNGQWRLTQKIPPSMRKQKQYTGRFGRSLAINKGVLAIGATDEDSETSIPNSVCIGCGAGAVYLYSQSGGQWKQTARITPMVNADSSDFGTTLDLDHNTLIVGSPNMTHYHDITKKIVNANKSGGVYIFNKQKNNWIQTYLLTPKGNKSESNFGKSVAIDNNTVVIGGTHHQPPYNTSVPENSIEFEHGQIYIFEKAETSWVQSKLVNVSQVSQDLKYMDSYFAYSVDIEEDTIIVGNPINSFYSVRGRNTKYPYEVPELDHKGEVYIFKKHADQWRMQQLIQAANPLQSDHFGSAVRIKKATIVIGADGDSNQSSGINNLNQDCSLPSSGAVYTYQKRNNQWYQSDYIKSSNPKEMDFFGSHLDFDGKTIAVISDHLNVFSKNKHSWKENRIGLKK